MHDGINVHAQTYCIKVQPCLDMPLTQNMTMFLLKGLQYLDPKTHDNGEISKQAT